MTGTLYLVPTPLDFGLPEPSPITDQLPAGTIARAARITHWLSENAKSTRAFLQRVQAITPLAAAIAEQTIGHLEQPQKNSNKAHSNGIEPHHAF